MAIEKADVTQCQAEKHNGYNFMTIGGKPAMERCTNEPHWIAIERSAGDDDEHGYMSLCNDCKLALITQMDENLFLFAEINTGGK